MLTIKDHIYAITGMVLFGAAPLLCAFLAWGVADVLGCDLSMVGPQPCKVVGIDIGAPLLVMAMMIPVAFFTVPVAGFFIGAYILAMIALYIVQKYKNR